jgi:hypothetical protein
MSRTINNEVKDSIYNYLLEQWLLFDRKPVRKSLSEIGEAIKVGHIDPTMVRFYLKRLEKENKIVILQSGILGRNSMNAYKIVEENVGEIEEIKEEKREEVKKFNEGIEENDNLVEELTQGIQKLRQLKVDANKYHYLINLLQQLEPFGNTIDGDQIFTIPANFSLKEIIECYGNKTNKIKNCEINPINEKRSDLN